MHVFVDMWCICGVWGHMVYVHISQYTHNQNYPVYPIFLALPVCVVNVGTFTINF